MDVAAHYFLGPELNQRLHYSELGLQPDAAKITDSLLYAVNIFAESNSTVKQFVSCCLKLRPKLCLRLVNVCDDFSWRINPSIKLHKTQSGLN